MTGLSEFELIKKYFSSISYPDNSAILLGVGDDCGMITPPSGKTLCFSIDTLVEGVHFPSNAPPFELAYRALATSMSDLAAMGAEPLFFTLALTLPEVKARWLERFSSGLRSLADQFEFPLLGGDTTKGPLAISIQVHGLLEKPGLTRSGAKPGDIVAVSGTLGNAGGALALLSKPVAKLNMTESYLLARYYKPTPRIVLGQQLLESAHACIDISDGLLAEASHLSERSSVRIDINSLELPLSEQLIDFVGEHKARDLALSSGDDYELLFTMSEPCWRVFSETVSSVPVKQIGRVSKGSGVFLDNATIAPAARGYQHFD